MTGLDEVNKDGDDDSNNNNNTYETCPTTVAMRCDALWYFGRLFFVDKGPERRDADLEIWNNQHSKPSSLFLNPSVVITVAGCCCVGRTGGFLMLPPLRGA